VGALMTFNGHMSSEATQTVTVYDVLAWIESNKKSLLVGFVAAVVIGFGIAIYRYNADQRELAASDALLKLKTTLSSSDTANPPDAADYLKVAQQYPGTSAAERALLLAGSTLFTQGKYAEAQAEFSKFQRDRPQGPFAATAAYGIAASLEAQGKQDEALAPYQNLSVRYPNSSVLDDAKLAIARIYEAKNQPKQALQMYDELTKPGALSTTGSEAMLRKDDLLTRHPELAKTNAPLAEASTMVRPASSNAPIASVKTSTNAVTTNIPSAASTSATPSKP
jgi:predicted negative regulator of RcsB-dependent stress response